VRTGEKLAGRYEVQDLLGEGGMGQVWRAVDQTLDRPVAVKTLSARLTGEDLQESLPRFQREGKAAARLNHPSIATIFDAGEHEGQLFMVLEFVNGEDLRRVLARAPGGLPVDQVLDIGAQVADGLAVAHEAGVIHRDIKPANVMLLSRGRVKICDFGIARLEGATSGLSVTGTVMGTMAYMPPEQMLGQKISGSADVYSLGATLFHLLTGRVVFPGDDLRVIIAQHLTAQPPDPAALRPDCPADLAAYLLTMLAKEPEHRPDAADVAGTLRALRAAPATPEPLAMMHAATVAVSRPAAPSVLDAPGMAGMPDIAVGVPGNAAASNPGSVATWMPPAAISGYMIITMAGAPSSLAFSPDGRTLAIASGVLQLWDLPTRRPWATYENQPGTADISSVSFSRGGRLLASGGLNADAIALRDVASGRVAATLAGLGPGARQVAFSPDDSLLAACTPQALGVWDVATRRLIAAERVEALGAIAFSPDGLTFAMGAAERVMLREVDRRASVLRHRGPYFTVSMRNASNRAVAFSPDGMTLASAIKGPGGGGAVHLWNVASGQSLSRLPARDVVSMAFSPAGDVIASAEHGKSVKLWEAGSGRRAGTLDCAATCLAFSPDGTYLAVGCTREVRVWTSRQSR
jgi:hypothetical protein